MENSWVKALDKWETRWTESFRITQNIGRGMIFTGTNNWKNYTVSSKLKFQLVKSGGIAARIQGLKRYYALELTSNKKLRIVKMRYDLEILKEINFDFEFYKEYDLTLKIEENILKGSVNNEVFLEFEDKNTPLEHGGIGFIVESGTQSTNEITIS